jgi:hypothetical protein
MKEVVVGSDEFATISEINILPDGRVCLFGASSQVLEILDAISMGDPALSDRIASLRAAETLHPTAVKPTEHFE